MVNKLWEGKLTVNHVSGRVSWETELSQDREMGRLSPSKQEGGGTPCQERRLGPGWGGTFLPEQRVPTGQCGWWSWALFSWGRLWVSIEVPGVYSASKTLTPWMPKAAPQVLCNYIQVVASNHWLSSQVNKSFMGAIPSPLWPICNLLPPSL